MDAPYCLEGFGILFGPIRGFFEVASDGGEPERQIGLRPQTLHASERGRTAVPKTQGLSAHRPICMRIDKLGVMFLVFLNFAPVVKMIYDLA